MKKRLVQWSFLELIQVLVAAGIQILRGSLEEDPPPGLLSITSPMHHTPYSIHQNIFIMYDWRDRQPNLSGQRRNVNDE